MAVGPEPVAIQVRDSRGTWHHGFLLLEFLTDGTAAVKSERTGQVTNLPHGDWQYPEEETNLRRIALV